MRRLCGRIEPHGRSGADLQDLWTRWGHQAGQSAVVRTDPPESARIVYATRSVFDLKKYTPGSFKPGGKTSAAAHPGLDNVIYWLDASGRPVRMHTRHSHNKVDWRGIYEYSADEAEYREWCLQTGVCSQYDRVTFADGLPRTFQRLFVNSRGSIPAWGRLSPARLVETISSDRTAYSVLIEEYEARDGRIESGLVYTEGLGAPPMRSTLSYTYENGRLVRIVQQWPSGELATVFAARRPVSLKQLSATLSKRIAERTLELLEASGVDAPLVALELSYRAGETYAPFVVPATTRDGISDLSLVVAIDPDRWIRLSEEEFAPEMADFRERLRNEEEYGAGARMLREAARHVTLSAPRRVPTTEGFVAFAIDWEMEGDELASILKECGASPATLAEFRSRGWI